jgi:hypothetical protein
MVSGIHKRTRRKPNLLGEWRRWWATVAFVDALYKTRRADVPEDH